MSLPSVTLPLVVPGSPWIATFYEDSTNYFGGRCTGTGALTANILYAVPIVPISLSGIYNSSVAVDRIAVNVTTNAVGKKARLGCYARGANGKPGALLWDAGEIDVGSIAGVEATIARTLQCGVEVFLAIVSDGTPSLRLLEFIGGKTGQTVNNDNTLRFAWQVALAYTAGVTTLPDPFGTPAVSSAAPQIMLRAA